MTQEEQSTIKSEMNKVFLEKIDQWFSGQQDQQDGFKYETSFKKSIQYIFHEVFQYL